MYENDLSTASLPNNFENSTTMSWNGVTLKCMLHAVYQLWNINSGEHRKNLSLVFSDLQCYAITMFFAVVFLRFSCKGLDVKLK